MEVQDNALFPVLHFALDDLPTSTKAPCLDNANAQALLQQYHGKLAQTVDDELMSKCLTWLVGAGFLPPPLHPNPPKSLPALQAEPAHGHQNPLN